jgi:hypothetical protein
MPASVWKPVGGRAAVTGLPLSSLAPAGTASASQAMSPTEKGRRADLGAATRKGKHSVNSCMGQSYPMRQAQTTAVSFVYTQNLV